MERRTISGSANPLVSVVVPVRNGRADIDELLATLSDQTLPREQFEVVIGDDGSTDGGIAAMATADGWVRVSGGPPRNSYAARNRASRLTRGPILAFCDSDCRPAAAWLESGLRELERADLVGGRVRYLLPTRTTAWALLDMEMHLDQERAVESGYAVTANLFVRREVFDRVGGFDESLPNGGDYDLVARAVASGARLVYGPTAVVWHPTRQTASSFMRKVWTLNRITGIREARLGIRPRLLKKYYIPFVGMMRSRMGQGRPIRLDRRRLTADGLEPTLWQETKTLALIYLLLPYLAGAGRFAGWWQERRDRVPFDQQ